MCRFLSYDQLSVTHNGACFLLRSNAVADFPARFGKAAQVVVVLLSYGSKTSDIARKAGVKQDTAINAVKKLVQFGLLTKAKQWLIIPWGRARSNLTARQRPNLYVFTSFPLESAPPAPSTEMDILVARVERQIVRQQADTPLERALAALANRAGFTVTA